MKQDANHRKELTMKTKKSIAGVLFALPAMVGLVWLFLIPMADSLRMSLSKVTTGGKLTMTFIGLANFREAFTEHPYFNQYLVESLLDMLTSVPVILILSFLMAILIHEKFKGQQIARTILFLPIVLASSAMLSVDAADLMQATMQSADYRNVGTAGVLQSFQLADWLIKLGLPQTIVEYLGSAVDRVFEMITLSGVQMLILLAALQSIAPSLYEAAYVEGATGWEKFWIITFPMISPTLLLITIYSIIDSFTSNGNQTIRLIREEMNQYYNYGLGSALSWIYFVIIGLILALVVGIGSRLVYQPDKR